MVWCSPRFANERTSARMAARSLMGRAPWRSAAGSACPPSGPPGGSVGQSRNLHAASTPSPNSAERDNSKLVSFQLKSRHGPSPLDQGRRGGGPGTADEYAPPFHREAPVGEELDGEGVDLVLHGQNTLADALFRVVR